MKTNVLQKVALIIGIVFLSTGSVYGQKIKFSVKKTIESFKGDNQCHYCAKLYQFSTELKQITNIVNKLSGLSEKKKKKKYRRLQKAVDHFITNGSIQHSGLAQELASSKGKDQGGTLKNLIKLQWYIEDMSKLFKASPELLADATLQSAKTRLDMLSEALECTLTESNTP